MLMLAIPVVLILVLAGAIFGGQVIADSQRDHEIQQAIAATLGTSSDIELLNLQEVQYGYGVCGLYQSADSENGYASFFYDSVGDRLTLDVNSREFRSHCDLSAIC